MPTAEDVQARIAAVEAETGQTIPDVEPQGGVTAPPAPVTDPVVLSNDPFDVPTNTTFDRPYVERLRGEAAEARTRAKAYEDLEKLDPAKRDAWITIARTMETNPKQAYAWLDEIVKAAPQLQEEQGGPAPQSVVPDGEKPITRADLDAYFGSKEAERVEQGYIQEVYGELKAVGLNAESSDPVEAATAIAVMKVAADNTAGDIAAAYDLVVTKPRQAAIDAYVAEKAGKARIPGSSAPGAIPSQERQRPEGMSGLEWSRKLAMERINATQA